MAGTNNFNPNIKKIIADKNVAINQDELAAKIVQGDSLSLARAITLVESSRESDRGLAEKLLVNLSKQNPQKSIRIGITGVPGVGKSSFIEVLGQYLIKRGHKLAVLAIDPSSPVSHGSILGDKTRMNDLALTENVFIRPSPSGESLGGVAQATRESILLCEAAGFDIILIETVGVGQSEVAVQHMTDLFLLLMLAGAGDELQGIKRGIMEMADIVAITKADGDNIQASKNARLKYIQSLHLFPSLPSAWIPKVLTCSAEKNLGIEEIWNEVESYFNAIHHNGWFAQNRKHQNTWWYHEAVKNQLNQRFLENDVVKEQSKTLEAQVLSGEISPIKAAQILISSL